MVVSYLLLIKYFLDASHVASHVALVRLIGLWEVLFTSSAVILGHVE